GDHDRIARLGIGFLQSLVYRDSGTKDWGGRVPVDAIGQTANIIWIGEHVSSKAPIDRIAGVFLQIAKRFPAGETVPAMPAGGMQPRHADPVSFRDRSHTRACCGDSADAFMSGYEGWVRLSRPVAVSSV